MDKNLSTKIVIGLLVFIILVLCGFGIYKLVTSEGTFEAIEDVENEKTNETDEKDLVEELSGYIPASYHVFDSEVEGYTTGKVKLVLNIDDTAMIKMAIRQINILKEKYVIPESIGTREIYIDGERVDIGDIVDVFRYRTIDIKKQITKMFGEEKAENVVFPEYISYGHLSKNYNHMYYLVDDYYIEAYAQLGNLCSYSKTRTNYKILDDTITLDYIITSSCVGGTDEQWNSKETFKKDKDGNYIWQSLEKIVE